MSDTNHLLHLILERITTLEKSVIAAIPRSRRSRKMQKITVTANELLDSRVKKVTELFQALISMDLSKRAASKFPSYLMESGDEPNFGAVTEAILVNRASMLLLFKPVFIYNETSANDTARAAVREAAHRGAFVVCPLCDSGIRVDAEYKANTTMIVMTHTCARKWTAVYGAEPLKKKIELKPAVVSEDDDRIWKPAPRVPVPVQDDDDRIWKPKSQSKRCPSHLEVLDASGNCQICLFEKENEEKDGVL